MFYPIPNASLVVRFIILIRSTGVQAAPLYRKHVNENEFVIDSNVGELVDRQIIYKKILLNEKRWSNRRRNVPRDNERNSNYVPSPDKRDFIFGEIQLNHGNESLTKGDLNKYYTQLNIN